MKKRLRKKRYKEYASGVMADVSSPPGGFDRPNYRGVLRELPEFTPIALDTTDPALFSDAARSACRKYGLYFYAYRRGEPDSCFLVIVSLEYPQISEFSYNDLTSDIPLPHYQVLTDGVHGDENWGKVWTN